MLRRDRCEENTDFIEKKVISSPEWANAWALLQVARAIEGLGDKIGGVDNLTGIQKIGDCLEWMARIQQKETNKNGGE